MALKGQFYIGEPVQYHLRQNGLRIEPRNLLRPAMGHFQYRTCSLDCRNRSHPPKFVSVVKWGRFRP